MKKSFASMQRFLRRLRPVSGDKPSCPQCVTNWFAAALVGSAACALVLSLRGLSTLDAWMALSGAGLRQGLLYQPLTCVLAPSGVLLFFLCGGVAVLAGRLVEPAMSSMHWAVVLLSCTALGSLVELALDPAALVRGAGPPALAALTCAAAVLPLMPLPAGPWIVRTKTACLAGIAAVAVALAAAKFGSGIAPFRQAGATLASSGVVCAVAWLYLRFAGLTGPTWPERRWSAWRAECHRRAVLPAGDYIAEFVDPLLEKLHREGPAALSRKERAILAEGRRRLLTPPPEA